MKKFHSFLSLYPLTGPKVSFLPLFVVHLLSLKFHFFPLCSPFTGPKVSFFPHFIVHLLIICLCVVSSTLKGWPCLGVRVEEGIVKWGGYISNWGVVFLLTSMHLVGIRLWFQNSFWIKRILNLTLSDASAGDSLVLCSRLKQWRETKKML